MKTLESLLVVPAALAMLSIGAGVVRSQPVQITSGFKPDPLVLTGTSGGSQIGKGCGNVGATPNHIVKLDENFNYLRFSVQSDGQPILFIKAPSGNSCVQADRFSEGKVEAPGYWEKGTYSIYVGDRADGQHNYKLSITTERP